MIVNNRFTKTSQYLLTCYVADGDILNSAGDVVEDLVGLQAEGGYGEQDEEEGAKRHVLQGQRERSVTVQWVVSVFAGGGGVRAAAAGGADNRGEAGWSCCCSPIDNGEGG